MPFTPYHLGPSSWIGLILFKTFDFPTLFISSVIIDIEPLCVLLFNLDYPLHGFFHSFLGGSTLAILTAISLYFLKDFIQQIMSMLKLKQDSSFKKILWTSFFGVYFHIVLDAPLYADIKPFYPFQNNPLYGLFSSQHVYLFCVLSFIIGILTYLIKIFLMTKKEC